jgi:Copper binding proteins, plastocyanin/azurin family
MKRIHVLLGAAAVALAATSAATPMTLPKLRGTVGPGFTISLKRGLAPVKVVKTGKYTFVVSDKSSIHNFVIESPRGVDRTLTTVGFVGTKTVTILLARGTYKFYCAPHESSMRGSFKVTL